MYYITQKIGIKKQKKQKIFAEGLTKGLFAEGLGKGVICRGPGLGPSAKGVFVQALASGPRQRLYIKNKKMLIEKISPKYWFKKTWSRA